MSVDEEERGAGFLWMVLIMVGILWAFAHHHLDGIKVFAMELEHRLYQVPDHFEHPVIAQTEKAAAQPGK